MVFRWTVFSGSGVVVDRVVREMSGLRPEEDLKFVMLVVGGLLAAWCCCWVGNGVVGCSRGFDMGVEIWFVQVKVLGSIHGGWN